MGEPSGRPKTQRGHARGDRDRQRQTERDKERQRETKRHKERCGEPTIIRKKVVSDPRRRLDDSAWSEHTNPKAGGAAAVAHGDPTMTHRQSSPMYCTTVIS